jgi:formylglycine-generating enzyme
MLCSALALAAICGAANAAQFFRVVGPTAVTMTACTPDGCLTWTNAQIGTNYTVQTAAALGAASNWVDFIRVPASNSITTERVFDPNPPTNMVLIPAGSFTMGDCMGDTRQSGETPLHTVYVSAFYMDQYLVTKSLWDTVVAWNGGNGYSYYGLIQGKANNHPVQSLWWNDAVRWCNARSQKEGLTPCYYTDTGLTVLYKTLNTDPYVNWSANGYRLPTEAEWEKAARGGLSGHRFPWGDTISESQANYYSWSSYSYDLSNTGYNPAFNDGVMPYTSPVGYFAGNGYGLHDMAGNVYEWCWDWYSNTYYNSSPGADPRGPATQGFNWARLLRGGYWSGYAGNARCAYRYHDAPSVGVSYYGFRCVRGH